MVTDCETEKTKTTAINLGKASEMRAYLVREQNKPDQEHDKENGPLIDVMNLKTNTSMLWYRLGRPEITSEIANWPVFVLLGWRFVFGIITKREGREPISPDAITTLGIIKLFHLRFKVRNRQRLAK